MDKQIFKGTINGIEKDLEVLYTFYSPFCDKDFIICTDNEKTNGELNIYAFIYDPDDENKELENIVNDKDWEEIESFLETVTEK